RSIARGHRKRGAQTTGRVSYLERFSAQAEGPRRRVRNLELVPSRRFPQNGHAVQSRQRCLQKLQPLGGQFELLEKYTGGVPTWPRETGDVTPLERIIIYGDDHNGNRRRGLSRCEKWRFTASGKNDVHSSTYQLSREGGKPLNLALGVPNN